MSDEGSRLALVKAAPGTAIFVDSQVDVPSVQALRQCSHVPPSLPVPRRPIHAPSTHLPRRHDCTLPVRCERGGTGHAADHRGDYLGTFADRHDARVATLVTIVTAAGVPLA